MRSRAGAGFRRAVWGSVALHAAGACALVVLLRGSAERAPAQAGIDTRAHDSQVRMSLPAEIVVEVAPPVAAPPAKPQAAEEKKQEPEAPKATQHADANVQRAGATEPLRGLPLASARAVPNALSSELVALIRRPGPPAQPRATAVPAIHGALAPARVVVYVLDCSGSMGAGGKFDAARAALVATLEQQPATVRFQVIVYAGGAKPLLASDGAALPATATNVRAAADALAVLDARGASNHREAVRAAVGFNPDVILLLTDADDLSAAALRPVLAAAQKPVSLCVGVVGPKVVERVRELK